MSKSKLTRFCEKLPHVLVVKADEREGPWCNGLQASWIIKDELEKLEKNKNKTGTVHNWKGKKFK